MCPPPFSLFPFPYTVHSACDGFFSCSSEFSAALTSSSTATPTPIRLRLQLQLGLGLCFSPVHRVEIMWKHVAASQQSQLSQSGIHLAKFQQQQQQQLQQQWEQQIKVISYRNVFNFFLFFSIQFISSNVSIFFLIILLLFIALIATFHMPSALYKISTQIGVQFSNTKTKSYGGKSVLFWQINITLSGQN